jgi:curved DNA binding protein
MKLAISKAVVDADIYTVCQEVDAFIEAECRKVFNAKKTKNLERGIAFPCCISVNNVVGHFSPLDDESRKLAQGDVAKIICGAHIDGFAANTAHTVVVGTGKVEGRAADVVLAAHHALRAAERAIRDGSHNYEVTEAMNKVAAEYNCNCIEGVLSHIQKQFCIDGNKVIIGKEVPLQNVEDWSFVPGEVIHLDVYVSTGEGKPKLAADRTTVYKREVQTTYNLKIQKSRQFFAEANKRFPSLPFSLRAFADKTGAKVGVKECIDHELMQEYPVLVEKEGEFVAHFKSTVVVQPRSTAIIAGALPLDASRFASVEVKNAEVAQLINRDLWVKEKVVKEKK